MVGSREIRVAKLLLASGRAPNVEALRLDELGIEHDRAGILVDELMRTSVDGIWAAGDVTGRYQFTPIAQYQARIAIDDMFERDPAPADYSVLPTAIFTEPELAAVGLTEQEARDQGIEHEAVVHDIKYVQRSSYKDQKRGLYKIVYETGNETRPRAPCRRAERGRHRPGPVTRASVGGDGRRPGRDAPRLPDLRRGREGSSRAGDAAARRDGGDLQLKRALKGPYMCQVPPTRRPAGLDERTFSHAYRFVKGQPTVPSVRLLTRACPLLGPVPRAGTFRPELRLNR